MFSPDGTLISASAAPHCGAGMEKDPSLDEDIYRIRHQQLQEQTDSSTDNDNKKITLRHQILRTNQSQPHVVCPVSRPLDDTENQATVCCAGLRTLNIPPQRRILVLERFCRCVSTEVRNVSSAITLWLAFLGESHEDLGWS